MGLLHHGGGSHAKGNWQKIMEENLVRSPGSGRLIDMADTGLWDEI